MQRHCKIITSRQLTDTIYAITLEGEELGKLSNPGQFLHILCGGGAFLRRPISICDVRDGYIKIVFEVKGAGTRWLADQKSGTLDVLGPLGRGFDSSGRNAILVGGGIGVPPLLYTARAHYGTVTAVLGFQSARNVILKDEFRDVCDQVVITTEDGSAGEQGRVTAPLEALLQSGGYDKILTCGPTPMLRAVADLAARYGVSCETSLEERMACGVGACLGCAVTMVSGENLRACKDGPVFDSKEVNWNA